MILIFAPAPSAMSVTSAQRKTSSPTRAFVIVLPFSSSQRGFEIVGVFSADVISVSFCVSSWIPPAEVPFKMARCEVSFLNAEAVLH